jgi:DNA-directed RNA polymerase specialized sigma24 family protein
MAENCNNCGNKCNCVTPCKKVDEATWDDDRVMERHYSNCIVCYPKNKEIHFAELDEHEIEQFSTDDVVPWSSGEAKIKQTAVFIERFFNKIPCKELAEKFEVKENTIVCMYKNAVNQLYQMIDKLDARREGLKATKAERFTEDQKFFLLTIFGFSGAEVARMFKRNRDVVNQKIKRMTDQYGALFEGKVIKEKISIEDPPMKDKLTRADVLNLVELYSEQGLSHHQAFKRIAERYSEHFGRLVNVRAIESRYYKAMRKLDDKSISHESKPSVYEGLSVTQIKERMSL